MDQSLNLEILGKNYNVKCPSDRTHELRQAAIYVDKEMRKVRDQGKIIGLDRIAIITALNLAYQLLNLEQKENKDIDDMASRIRDMQRRIEIALTQTQQLELAEE